MVSVPLWGRFLRATRPRKSSCDDGDETSTLAMDGPRWMPLIPAESTTQIGGGFHENWFFK
ncbi:hypothetical protein RB12473 [Rhodopirellula baltica SH 1]|uniref:Uncharacterized protein n=1 Tax=Rhodopirellula baltica (strain DSM 10527 / NCIMB 13988 / SH1) TaxID=243090 RepID=Q7UIK5_RHOBA|nr:hypothetical protein RB12473 [Rhodopirellula baltica SH 1]